MDKDLLELEPIDVSVVDKKERGYIEKIGDFLMQFQIGYPKTEKPFYDRGFLFGYLFQKQKIDRLEEENQQLRDLLDNNTFILKVRKSMTNAEVRRMWRLMLEKKQGNTNEAKLVCRLHSARKNCIEYRNNKNYCKKCPHFVEA